MAELYSDFLFNPFGSSCAPPPRASLLPKFPCPRPRFPGQEQPLGKGFVPGLLFHRVPSTPACPSGSGEVSSTQECLLASLGNGEAPGVQGCSGSLPCSGHESGSLEQRAGSFQISSQAGGNLSYSQSLPSYSQSLPSYFPVTSQFLPPELRSLEGCLFAMCFP